MNALIKSLRTFLILLIFTFFWTNNAMASSYDSITYNLSTRNINNSILNVEIILEGHFDHELILNLPFGWAGAKYIEQIKHIQAPPEYKIDLIHDDNKAQAVIKIPDNHKNELQISYEIHQKAGDPSSIFEAIIRNNLVHTPGYGLFAIPHDFNDKINVSINWQETLI